MGVKRHAHSAQRTMNAPTHRQCRHAPSISTLTLGPASASLAQMDSSATTSKRLILSHALSAIISAPSTGNVNHAPTVTTARLMWFSTSALSTPLNARSTLTRIQWHRPHARIVLTAISQERALSTVNRSLLASRETLTQALNYFFQSALRKSTATGVSLHAKPVSLASCVHLAEISGCTTAVRREVIVCWGSSTNANQVGTG